MAGDFSRPAPIILFQVKEPKEKDLDKISQQYQMPLYVTNLRDRKLNDSDLIMYINTNTKTPKEFWALNGTAFICESN